MGRDQKEIMGGTIAMVNKSVVLVIILVVVVFSAVSCSNNNIIKLNKNKTLKTVLVTEKNNGQEIVLHKGDRIKLSLNEAADGGYAWHFVTFNSNCLKVLKNESRQINTQVMGGYNRRTLLIEALKKCRTNIKLKEYRSWEGENKAIKEIFIKINIIE